MNIKIKKGKTDLIKDDDIIRMLSVGCRALGDDLLHLHINGKIFVPISSILNISLLLWHTMAPWHIAR